MAIIVSGKTYQFGSVGFVIALVVLIICIVLMVISKGTTLELGMIAALAVAYLLS